ncbi:ATP synthase F1 subunit gamma, partial [Longimicrobium sp.]|uniref:ATP synthase F1 subunit gamma n=1 Tax=Longimicrobium sp. TaxID=2029185 RepID=UPI002F9393CB
MAKARELKGRIRSVQNTRKITRTMEMVSTSKLKRAQDRVEAARPYAERLAGVIGRLLTPELAARYPLLRQPERVRRAAVLLLTSNRGLAGAFNANLIRETRGLLARLRSEGAEVELHAAGKKGIGFFRYQGETLRTAASDISDRPGAADAQRLVDGLMEQFIAGELDAVYVVYAKFNSALSTPPTTMQLLPVAPPEGGQGGDADYILEPSGDEILGRILPLYVRNSVYRALVETIAGFYGAQRTAMKNATDNAGDMLEGLTRTYNRVRQA